MSEFGWIRIMLNQTYKTLTVPNINNKQLNLNGFRNL